MGTKIGARDWILLTIFFIMIYQLYILISLQSTIQNMNGDLLILGQDMYGTLELLVDEVYKDEK